MRHLRVVALLALVAAAAIGVPAVASAGGPPSLPAHGERPVCGPPAAVRAACHAHVVTTTDGVTPLATTSYTNGFRPLDLQSAYKIVAPATTPTVAIVDAYDNPSIEQDLGAYRLNFNLPPCTTANGCFSKVNQTGGNVAPSGNVGWGQEIALDVEMVSAICPTCHILLVEASSNTFADLATAVDYAAAHASAVSNSYGGNEFVGETNYEAHYNHQGIAITVSSGDNGYGVEYPAASRYVTAVGGTSLTTASTTRGWSETAWSGAGSGCSAYITKPAWQTDSGGCSRRTVADVSAVANPSTGVAVYDSYGSSGGANWMVFGGTSVAAPIIATVFAAAGPLADPTARYPYDHRSLLFDAVGGSNGSCGGSYLCTAIAGFDGPTGLGTPNGTGAFGAGGSTSVGGSPTPLTVSLAKSCGGGTTCAFTASGSGGTGTVTYSWSGATATSTGAATASQTYTAANSYTVAVTATDSAATPGTPSASTNVTCSLSGGNPRKRTLRCS